VTVKTAENGAQTSRILCPALRAKAVKLSPDSIPCPDRGIAHLRACLALLPEAKYVSLNNLRLLILGS